MRKYHYPSRLALATKRSRLLQLGRAVTQRAKVAMAAVSVPVQSQQTSLKIHGLSACCRLRVGQRGFLGVLLDPWSLSRSGHFRANRPSPLFTRPPTRNSSSLEPTPCEKSSLSVRSVRCVPTRRVDCLQTSAKPAARCAARAPDASTDPRSSVTPAGNSTRSSTASRPRASS